MPQPNGRVQLLAPDTVLQQRYKIERHIGTGGYANVYRAIDMQHRRERAIKEVIDADGGVRKQFEVEAGLLIQSTHPNIPRGYQLFEERGRLYLVMEFVRGRDLEDLLNESLVQRRRPLDEMQVLDWAIEVCGALTEMHDREPPVIHRDIKPANIKITPEGHPVLIDFGLAKVQAQGPTHTAAQGVSPGFAPPEQYMAKGATDARTDIYGMGATLYASLTGKDPPDAPSRLLAQTSVPGQSSMGQPMIPPRELAARTVVISEATNRLVVRALELAPSQRQHSAQELRDELLAARSWLAANGVRGSGGLVRGSGGLALGSGGLPSGKNAVPPSPPRLVPPGAPGVAQPAAAPAFPPTAAQRATGKPPVAPARPQPVPPAAPGAPSGLPGVMPGVLPGAKPGGKPAKPAAKGPVPPLARPTAMPTAMPPGTPPTPPITTQQPVAPLPLVTRQQPAARVERFEAFPASPPSAASAAPIMPPSPMMAAPASVGRVSGSRGGAAVALAEEPATAGALALAVPVAPPAPPVVPSPNSRKRRGAASQSAQATLAAAPAGLETAAQPRPWLDLKGLELKAIGKVALGLAAVETCWGVFLLSLGGVQLGTRGQDRLQPYFVLALIWLCVVVVVIAIGGQILSRPVRRRGKLTPVRRGLQGAGLTLHAVAVHGLAIWGAIMLGQHRLDPALAVFAFGLFAVNVLANGIFSLINTLG